MLVTAGPPGAFSLGISPFKWTGVLGAAWRVAKPVG